MRMTKTKLNKKNVNRKAVDALLFIENYHKQNYSKYNEYFKNYLKENKREFDGYMNRYYLNWLLNQP